MAVYNYQALNTRSRPCSGVLTAESPRQARDSLRRQGLMVLHVSVRKTAAKSRWRWNAWSHNSARLAAFYRELTTLLRVGLPILEALDTLSRGHKGVFRTVLLELRDRIASGASLAQAMAEHPSLFDELSCRIVEVGQDAGTLETALDRLARFKDRSRQLRSKLTTALIYPALVSSMAIVITLFLMTFVVPNILTPLLEQGRPLPLLTQIVKSASDLLLNWGWLMGVSVLLLIGSVHFLLGLPGIQMRWHRGLLKVPLVGDLILKQEIVRMAVVMSTLLRSGVVFLQALRISQKTAVNRVIRQVLVSGEEAVLAGSDIGQALGKAGIFPPLVVQVFTLGQQSGELDDLLEHLADEYDQQLSVTSQRLAAVLEPVLIIVLAMVVLSIVLATMLPILEAGDVLG